MNKVNLLFVGERCESRLWKHFLAIAEQVNVIENSYVLSNYSSDYVNDASIKLGTGMRFVFNGVRMFSWVSADVDEMYLSPYLCMCVCARVCLFVLFVHSIFRWSTFQLSGSI